MRELYKDSNHPGTSTAVCDWGKAGQEWGEPTEIDR